MFFSTISSLYILVQAEQLGYSVAQMELAKPAPLSHLLFVKHACTMDKTFANLKCQLNGKKT